MPPLCSLNPLPERRRCEPPPDPHNPFLGPEERTATGGAWRSAGGQGGSGWSDAFRRHVPEAHALVAATLHACYGRLYCPSLGKVTLLEDTVLKVGLQLLASC